MNNINFSEFNNKTVFHENESFTSNFSVPFENILHDIKTPMLIMYAYINELEGELRYNTGVLNTVLKIKKHWFRVMKLISDGSDYKRISSGVMTPTFKNLDIIYLIRELTNSTRVLSDRKNISMNFISDIKTLVMAADKNIIERILLNLLSNSIKFTDRGGKIDVSVISNNGSIFVTVKDNGVGIDSDKLSCIFERYYTDVNELNTQGVGLGLYIVKELVALLNGDIFIKSSEGTEITVAIPIKIIEDTSTDQKYFSNFYDDNIVQIELSDEY